jgi:hypothetical protein
VTLRVGAILIRGRFEFIAKDFWSLNEASGHRGILRYRVLSRNLLFGSKTAAIIHPSGSSPPV